ncbi:MAG: bifunctional ornithine acetyltransferase/N-acetylglutamate synthase [Eubacteriales bacterium]
MNFINGGVCAPKGFKASGLHCGIRKNQSKKDLALIVSEKRAAAAAVYTTNLVKGAPITVTKENLSDGYARAIICNSGNANTCNPSGVEIAKETCLLIAKQLDISPSDVIIASTGVIGQVLDITPIKNAIPALCEKLGDNSVDAAHAIMTTDTALKELAVSFEIDGRECRLGGIAKGSGMIHPNMATMLAFLTTDVAITPQMLQKALSADVTDSFNMISIDGDTSTNDMVAVLANGMAGNTIIDTEGKAFDTFKAALATVTKKLSKMIAADGEGATKLIECVVQGAADNENAKIIAKSVICSSLVKAAMFGADANWGRILCAIGYSGAKVNINKVQVSFISNKGSVTVCKDGVGVPFSEEEAKEILLSKEIIIDILLEEGEGTATAWGCDLTYDYVKINGDYRT